MSLGSAPGSEVGNLSDYHRDIRWTLNSTPGPLRLTYHAYKWVQQKASQEYGQILQKHRYTVNNVPLTTLSENTTEGAFARWIVP